MKPRKNQIDLRVTTAYRCVTEVAQPRYFNVARQIEPHQKEWVLARLAFLSRVFAVDVLSWAVLTYSVDLVLDVDLELASSWSDEEVIDRYTTLFPSRSMPPSVDDELKTKLIAVWRERLSSVSWFMRSLNQYIACRANEEDGESGAFWKHRFRSVALLDDSARLTAMSDVDLSAIRAHEADSLSSSEYTSIQTRLWDAGVQSERDAKALVALMPFRGTLSSRRSLPFDFLGYLALLAWTAKSLRMEVDMNDEPPSLLRGFNLAPHAWSVGFRADEISKACALGKPRSFIKLSYRYRAFWGRGLGLARRLYRLPKRRTK